MKPIMEEIEEMKKAFNKLSPQPPNRLEIPNHRMPEFSEALNLETKEEVEVNAGKKSGYSSLVYKGMQVQIAMNNDAKIQLWRLEMKRKKK